MTAVAHETPDTLVVFTDCEGPDLAGDDIRYVAVTERRQVDRYGALVPLHRRPLPTVACRDWSPVLDTAGGLPSLHICRPPAAADPARETREAVLMRLAAGDTCAEIAHALGLTERTVRGFIGGQTRRMGRPPLPPVPVVAGHADRWIRSPRALIGSDWYASLDYVDCGRWIRAAPGSDGPFDWRED